MRTFSCRWNCWVVANGLILPKFTENRPGSAGWPNWAFAPAAVCRCSRAAALASCALTAPDSASAATTPRRSWCGPSPRRDKSEFPRGSPSMLSLDQLQVGQRGRIEAVRGADSLVQRLLEMGLFEGEVVEVIGFAPLGDPVAIGLR